MQASRTISVGVWRVSDKSAAIGGLGPPLHADPEAFALGQFVFLDRAFDGLLGVQRRDREG